MNNTTFDTLVQSITPSELYELAEKLVAIPSYPEVGTQKIVMWLKEFASCQGLPVSVQPVADDLHVNLLIGYPKLDVRPWLMLNGHLDTVPPAQNNHIPKVCRRFLFGRGAADMKGAVAAMVMAFVALQRSRFPLSKPVMLAAVAGEEIGGLGTKVLLREVKPHACIIGEPTKLRLVVAHKGVEWIEIVVHGRAAHASCPQAGVNSIVWAAAIVQALENLGAQLARERNHPLLGAPTLNVGVIQGGTAPNIVPDKCLIRIDRRWLPGEDIKAIYAEIHSAVSHVIKDTLGVRVDIKRMKETMHSQPMETCSDHPFVRVLQQVAKEERLPADLYGVPYGTDGSLFAAQRIPTVVWGPGDIAQAHTVNEFVDLEELWIAARFYLRAIISICTQASVE
jgi:acetylornithine deacetylase/succinyl-diaminopimelate desuccinylase